MAAARFADPLHPKGYKLRSFIKENPCYLQVVRVAPNRRGSWGALPRQPLLLAHGVAESPRPLYEKQM